MIKNVEEIEFSIHGDERGKLIAVEGGKDLNFQIGRIYYIYDTCEHVIRGKHAHMALHQVMLCVSGSCDVLIDNGREREVVKLNSPNRGIYINNLVWREMMSFSPNCVLLVIVDRPYDPDDYIFDYDAFVRLANEK